MKDLIISALKGTSAGIAAILLFFGMWIMFSEIFDIHSRSGELSKKMIQQEIVESDSDCFCSCPDHK